MAVKSLGNKEWRKFGKKNFGKLKFICNSIQGPVLLNANQWIRIVVHKTVLVRYSKKSKAFEHHRGLSILQEKSACVPCTVAFDC